MDIDWKAASEHIEEVFEKNWPVIDAVAEKHGTELIELFEEICGDSDFPIELNRG